MQSSTLPPSFDPPESSRATSPTPLPPQSPPPSDPAALNQVVERAFAQWKGRLRKEKSDTARAKYLYRINLILLLVLVVLTWIVCWRHFEPFVAQTIFIGAPITLWGVFKLIEPWIPKSPLAEDKRSLAERVLQHPYATAWLAVGLCSALLLLSTTSSLYLQYGENAAVELVEVEVLDGDRPFQENLVVSSNNRIQGYPRLFDFGRITNPSNLRFHVHKPFGYELKDEAYRTGFVYRSFHTIHLEFPGSFQAKEYHVCRLIPGKEFLTLSFRSSEGDANPTYQAEITVNSGPPMTCGVWRDCIYFGAEEQAVKILLDREGLDARKRIVRNVLARGGIPAAELDAQTIALLDRTPWTPFPNLRLKAGDKIQIVIKYDATDMLRLPSYTIPSNSGIHDLPLEM